VDKLLRWAQPRTTPGIRRGPLRKQILHEEAPAQRAALEQEYAGLSDPVIADAPGARDPAQGGPGIQRGGTCSTADPPREQEPASSCAHSPQRRQNPWSSSSWEWLSGHGHRSRQGVRTMGDRRLPQSSTPHGRPGTKDCSGVAYPPERRTITSLENIRLVKGLLDPATLLTVRAHRG